jgi:hypothetical protein
VRRGIYWSKGVAIHIATLCSGKGLGMPQMFDWIFFAIMLPFPAFLVWDFYRHRETSKRVQQL